jgi:hypothetical protein
VTDFSDFIVQFFLLNNGKNNVEFSLTETFITALINGVNEREKMRHR